jgi:GNAT superfamily N-acetyltransferase
MTAASAGSSAAARRRTSRGAGIASELTTPLPRFRRARPDEAAAITRLALRSKRHWGYDEAFMAALTPELTFTPEDLEGELDHVEVLESADGLLGVFRLRRRTELALLTDLWIEPAAMGRGYGRLAFERAAEVARSWGAGVMELEADPHAEPFYLHLGAVRVSMSPVTVVPGRAVPLMRFAL